MSSPTNLNDLPVGNLALSNDDSAVLLMRVGLTDYQVAVSIIRNINLQALQTLPNGTPLNTDLMLVNRIVSGVATNYQVTFGSVGFPLGTKMWFYDTMPPAPNWTLVPNTGNSLLACADQSAAPYGTYNGSSGGANTGSWQQANATLTIAQIPAHSHGVNFVRTVQRSSGSQNTWGLANPAFDAQVTQNTGGGGAHNHGNTWRPMANVGVIGIKVF